jgi:hypothetical protein
MLDDESFGQNRFILNLGLIFSKKLGTTLKASTGWTGLVKEESLVEYEGIETSM